MKTLILFVMLLNCSAVFSQVNESLIPRWARIDHRTQGGGWLWFPANASASTEYKADILAKGKALDYLLTECDVLHKDIRFVERFSIKSGGKFHVYVRANIKQNACEYAKKLSSKKQELISGKALRRTYVLYRQFVAARSMNFRKCNYHNFYCFANAVHEGEIGNDYKALAYLQHACQKGMKHACTSATKHARLLSIEPY